MFFILGDFFQGLFGGASDDQPNGSMQPCTVDEDCTIENEKCHAMKLCGTTGVIFWIQLILQSLD